MKQVAQIGDTVYVSQLQNVLEGQLISIKLVPKKEETDAFMAYLVDCGEQNPEGVGKPVFVIGEHVFTNKEDARTNSIELLEGFYAKSKEQIYNV